MKIQQIVRQIRQEQQMECQELARRASMHVNTVYRIENGYSVTVETFEKFLHALGYELEVMKK